MVMTHALALAPAHQDKPPPQQQRQPIKRELTPSFLYPGRPGPATPLSSGQFGRVPNFSSQYLSSLNSATYFETQPTPPTPSAVLAPPRQQHRPARGGQPLSPTSSGRSLGGTDQFVSNATIVSNAVSTHTTLPATRTPRDVVVVTTAKQPSSGPDGTVCKSPPRKRGRGHTIPTSIMLSPSQQRKGVTSPAHPVPEFLCHLYSMLNDPALADLISWIVPLNDETADLGGGQAGVGKIVILDPTRLQDEVLGKYYRHSKYSSFQRQLNYFGFKKRLHGSKKGKMCTCSFVHGTLSPDPHSLLNLKRRPPSGKRMALESSIATSQQKQGGHGSVACSMTGKHLKKGMRRGPAIPSNILLGGNIYASPASPMATNNVNSNENASWWKNTNQGSIAPAPLHMPSMAQTTAFPSNSWTHFGVDVSRQNPMMAPTFPTRVDTMIKSSPGKNDVMSTFANNVVLEAQKSLAQNFLKSQQEQQTPAYGEQMQQPPLHRSPIEIQQQQPLVEMPFSRLPTTKSPVAAARSHNTNNLEEHQEEAAIFSLPAKSVVLPPCFTAINPQENTSIHTVPSKTPVVANCNTNCAPSSATAIAVTNAFTNYFMAPSPTAVPIASNSYDIVPIASNSYETHPQGMTDTPPDQLSKFLSKFLETSLPPSEDLFDEDLSTGSMSDFGATILQVADDGMLMLP